MARHLRSVCGVTHHQPEGATAPAATSGVGALIKSQRKDLGLSQRALAKLAHVNHAYLSRVERGIYEPTPRWVRDVTTALGAELGRKITVNLGGAA